MFARKRNYIDGRISRWAERERQTDNRRLIDRHGNRDIDRERLSARERLTERGDRE